MESVSGAPYGQPAKWVVGLPEGGLLEYSKPSNAVAALSSINIQRSTWASALSLGFVPGPETILTNLYRVGAGQNLSDRAGVVTASLSFDKLFDGEPTCVSQAAAECQLLHLVKEALQEAVSRAKRVIFLQSGGKDSSLLALSLRDWRDKVVSVTYEAGVSEFEADSASKIASKCGFHHRVIKGNPERAWRVFAAKAQNIALPVFDFAFLSYLEIAEVIDAGPGDLFVDGLGIDLAFGVVPSRHLTWLRRMPHLTSMPQVQYLGETCAYALNRIAVPSHERMFPGTRYTDNELEALQLPVRTPHRSRVYGYMSERLERGSVEERTVAAALQESSAGFQKGEVVADAFGAEVAFPLANAKLGEWVSSLPKKMRLDTHARVNKVLMRNMIGREFGQVDYLRNKGSFRFDLVNWLERNKSALLDLVDVIPEEEVKRDYIKRIRQGQSKADASKVYLSAILFGWLSGRSFANVFNND